LEPFSANKIKVKDHKEDAGQKYLDEDQYQTEAPLDDNDSLINRHPPATNSSQRLREVETRSLYATIGPRSKICLDFQYRSLPKLRNKQIEEDPMEGEDENAPTVSINFYED